MGSQCQLYITNENPNENRNKYSRIIDKYSSTSYVRQLRVNSLRVQTNSNCYKSQEERGKKKKSRSILPPVLFIHVYRIFSLFFSQKLIKQTHATYVYSHLIHIAAMSSSGRRKQWKYFAVSIPSIYISRISISSYRARTRLLWISNTLFPFYFLVKSNSGS